MHKKEKDEIEAREIERRQQERLDRLAGAKMIREATRIEKEEQEAERIDNLCGSYRKDLLCAMIRNDMIHKNDTTHARRQSLELVNNLIEIILTGQMT